MAPSPKTYVRGRDKSVWKMETFTKGLSKTIKDTVRAFANSQVAVSTKENGETISLKAMVFFTLAEMKSLKVDSTKAWFPTVNLSKLSWLMGVTTKETTAIISDMELEYAIIQTAISTKGSGPQINVLVEER